MSTNHTPNYSLSQWQAADQVLRTDFNEDNAKIDAALKIFQDKFSSMLRLRRYCVFVHGSGAPLSKGYYFENSCPEIAILIGNDSFAVSANGLPYGIGYANGTIQMLTMKWYTDQFNFEGGDAAHRCDVEGKEYKLLVYFRVTD